MVITMNYNKKGLKKKQLELNSKPSRYIRKCLVLALKFSVFIFLIASILIISLLVGLFRGAIDSTPSITVDEIVPSGYSSFIYDKDGNQISKLVASDSNRIPVSLEHIPDHLENAFIAIEDASFYEHNGIDFVSIFRAGIKGALSGFNFSSGASTITQQLIKNTVFKDFMFETSFESLKRKIQEQHLAIELTQNVSKSEVIERYLNTINLGQNTLGVQSASLRYFNKDVADLTLSESAVIAGITKSPEGFNPINYPERNATRRKTILEFMLELKMITQEEYDIAIKDDPYSRILAVNEIKVAQDPSTYFEDAVTDQVYNDLLAEGYTDQQAYNLIYSNGIRINSTLDPNIQSIMDNVFSDPANFPDAKWELSYQVSINHSDGSLKHYSTEMLLAYLKENGYKDSFKMVFPTQEDGDKAISEYLSSLMIDGDTVVAEKKKYTPQPQVSMLIMDQHTGYVTAMIGGRGEKSGSNTFNRAIDAKRQPGSCFKVLSTYAPAIDMGTHTLASVHNDAPFYYSGLSNGKRKMVSNWDNKYHGLLNYREGIKWSRNIITVKALTVITPQVGMDYLLNFGFTTLLDKTNETGHTDVTQSLALGGITNGITNLEMTAAYASIANNGLYIKPTMYTTVTDRNGNVILDKSENTPVRILKDSTSWLLTNAMTDVVTGGTGTRARLSSFPVAGKTGTTQKNNDVWFSGYTPYYTASSWVGYDNNASLNSIEESLHLELWRKVMEEVHSDLTKKAFPIKPSNIVSIQVCRQSGLLPTEKCTDVYSEYFAKGTEPKINCNIHVDTTICGTDNCATTEYCPYKTPFTAIVPPIEDERLWEGSAQLETSSPDLSHTCHHTWEYMYKNHWHGVPPAGVNPPPPVLPSIP